MTHIYIYTYIHTHYIQSSLSDIYIYIYIYTYISSEKNMFSGRKKTPRGMSSRTPRGTFNRRTPVGSSIGNRGGASSTTKNNNNNINNNSMQRRMNYSAKFSNNNNSEYVSPAKKARTDFFKSRPSTLRMQQRISFQLLMQILFLKF